ncbi:MAG: hypothetical protein QOH31_419 [Verrucomicrobiota bacterium]|jgi:hypothetical protein
MVEVRAGLTFHGPESVPGWLQHLGLKIQHLITTATGSLEKQAHRTSVAD